MIEQPFRQTPLFQLNLLLWLSMPAKGGQIMPVFWENGFEIIRHRRFHPCADRSYNFD